MKPLFWTAAWEINGTVKGENITVVVLVPELGQAVELWTATLGGQIITARRVTDRTYLAPAQ